MSNKAAITAQPAPIQGTGRRDAPMRPLYLVSGIALTISAVIGAHMANTGVSSVLLWALLPDIGLLIGIGQPHQPGQLPARAVPAYNLLHTPVLPTLLLAGFATGLLGTYWAVAAVSWLAHISFDRAAGYGLRTADGWQRT